MSTAVELLANREYKYGLRPTSKRKRLPKGLSEDTVRLISRKKNEPEWLLEFRLKAYRRWLEMKQPNNWANFNYPNVDFQNISYYPRRNRKRKKRVWTKLTRN
jgi:Fe-S cluster assembly protein SufB